MVEENIEHLEGVARFDKLRKEYFDMRNKEDKKAVLTNNKRRLEEKESETKKEYNALDVTLKYLEDKKYFAKTKNGDNNLDHEHLIMKDDIQNIDPKYRNLQIHADLLFKNIDHFDKSDNKNVQQYYVEKNESRFENYITKK
ncbi:hypothetical protein QEN19_000156 [Hanseniaspora menglaensis]